MGFAHLLGKKETDNTPKAGETVSNTPSSEAEVIKEEKKGHPIRARYQMPPMPCTGCTEEGQVTDVKMAVYHVGMEHLCPLCTTEMEKAGVAYYESENVVHE